MAHEPHCTSNVTNLGRVVFRLVPSLLLIVVLGTLGCTDSDPPNAGGPESGDSGAVATDHKDAPESENSQAAPPAELAASYTEQIKSSLVEFEMVLVPKSEEGDAFYMGKTEVTWDEFTYWALCKDIKEKKAILEREKKLRPSAPHDTERIYRGWGQTNQPVVGVSRLAAERYCDWLSKETGKKYRLPTAEEWDRAFVAGGEAEAVGDAKQLEKIAWFEANTFDDDTLSNRAMPVASKAPNRLGIHDMLGNVCEWVSGDETRKVARGGSFITTADALKPEHEDVEDQSVWNKNYPNEPKSLWWYVDADNVGFRVVCDAE